MCPAIPLHNQQEDHVRFYKELLFKSYLRSKLIRSPFYKWGPWSVQIWVCVCIPLHIPHQFISALMHHRWGFLDPFLVVTPTVMLSERCAWMVSAVSSCSYTDMMQSEARGETQPHVEPRAEPTLQQQLRGKMALYVTHWVPALTLCRSNSLLQWLSP